MTVEDHQQQFSNLFKGRTILDIRLVCDGEPPNIHGPMEIKFEDGTMLILQSKLHTSEYGISPMIQVCKGKYKEFGGGESSTARSCHIHDDYYDNDPVCKICGSRVRYHDLITDPELPMDGYRCENENCEMNYPHDSLGDINEEEKA